MADPLAAVSAAIQPKAALPKAKHALDEVVHERTAMTIDLPKAIDGVAQEIRAHSVTRATRTRVNAVVLRVAVDRSRMAISHADRDQHGSGRRAFRSRAICSMVAMPFVNR